MTRNATTRLYIAAFVATLLIFTGALLISNFINARKTDEVKASEDKIAVDILALDTQFELIQNASCTSLDDSTIKNDLENLGARITFLEGQAGENNQDVFRLKRYYALLEIKDYLLVKKMQTECKKNTISILYFYGTKNCPDCTKAQYILQAVQDEYQDIRVYSFDYALDLPAVQTLVSIQDVPGQPPVFDINGTMYGSFDTLDALKVVINPLLATGTATTSLKR